MTHFISVESAFVWLLLLPTCTLCHVIHASNLLSFVAANWIALFVGLELEQISRGSARDVNGTKCYDFLSILDFSSLWYESLDN